MVLAGALHARFRIYAAPIERPDASVEGVRVTPHPYTTTARRVGGGDQDARNRMYAWSLRLRARIREHFASSRPVLP